MIPSDSGAPGLVGGRPAVLWTPEEPLLSRDQLSGILIGVIVELATV